jgi:Nif-specific regulatory protein
MTEIGRIMSKNAADTSTHPDDQAQLPAEILATAAHLLRASSTGEDESNLLREAAQALGKALTAHYVALMKPTAGHWTIQVDWGGPATLSWDLLGEALDQDQAVVRDLAVAVPLVLSSQMPRPAEREVLLVVFADPHSADLRRGLVTHLGEVLACGLDALRRRTSQAKRIKRLSAIIEMTTRWNKTREMEPLLTEIAETATEAIGADRATIFLWDQAHHQLVGRPALGVEEGELRIDDDRGIVGQVIQSGVPRRISRSGDTSQIDRQVDKQLGYRTESLLCVPLQGTDGQLLGAFELINKLAGDFNEEDQQALEELAAQASIVLKNTQEREQLLASRRQITDQAAQRFQLIGKSPAIEASQSTIRRVADTDLAILLLGENGTGKEVAAQCIHYLSRRRDQPFVAVNCAALTETLLESELFGHEKGAFTDAHESRPGKFELSSGGTLFLDEIGDMSLSGQSKLLRVLEEKVIVRVGGSQSIDTDIRVIAATNRNLAEGVRDGRFREDLYYRLNVVTMELPPLRDRGEDVLLLADHFLQQFCQQAGRPVPQLTADARRRLQSHPWPGNVRELRNLMERLAYLSQGNTIASDELAFILSPADAGPSMIAPDLTLTEATDTFQTEYIRKTIQRCDGNMSRAARRLGLHRSNLYRKLRQLEHPTDEPEEDSDQTSD